MKVQIEFLSGKNAGSVRTVERLPCVVGRAAPAGLRLEEPGVWDRHFQLEFSAGEGIALSPLSGGLVTVNGGPPGRVVLRNGDLIEAGAAKMRFWLPPTRQRGYRLREALTWIAFGMLPALEVFLIYRLMP